MANFWASQDGSFNAVTSGLHTVGGALFFVVGPLLELIVLVLGTDHADEALKNKAWDTTCRKYRNNYPLTHTTGINDAYNTIRKCPLRCECLRIIAMASS